MPTKEELLAKANKPGDDAMVLHPFYRGKVEIVPKCCVRTFDDFAIWYTPGVAKPCLDIHRNPETVFQHTNKANFVGVITDGTRVLGLGDIGPEASIPVMEGKALLFKYLGGVDAFPICLDTKDSNEFINIALKLQPVFGGFNLEDISQPKCFHILDTLREQARIPVWHDDQQGTAAVTVAGFINALRVVGKDKTKVRIAMMGAGASNVCIARMLMVYGVPSGNIIMADKQGTLHMGRTELKAGFKEKWQLCQSTNDANVVGEIQDAIKGADVLIALSAPGPDTVKKEWISTMADDAIVFVCANPTPEIWPWEAKEAGARIVATGRSDFPNQINNSLGFPGIFRGTLDVMATTITDKMCIAAAQALADRAYEQGIHEDYLVPTMDDVEVFVKEAVAVGLRAIQHGIAQNPLSAEQLYQRADTTIKRAREQVHLMMEKGFIPTAPV